MSFMPPFAMYLKEACGLNVSINGACVTVPDLHRPELFHHAEIVEQRPMLDQHPVADLEQVKHVDIDRAAGWCHFSKRAGMGRLHFEADQHLFALRNKIEKRQFHVGEGRQQHIMQLLDAFRPFDRERQARIVANKTRRDVLFHPFNIAAQKGGKIIPAQLLVGFKNAHGFLPFMSDVK